MARRRWPDARRCSRATRCSRPTSDRISASLRADSGFRCCCLSHLCATACRRSAEDGRRAFDGSAAPLALVVAGAWLSNAPLGVMASYLLAGVALAVAVLRALVGAVAARDVGSRDWLGPGGVLLVPAASSSAGSTFARPSTIRATWWRTAGCLRAMPNPALELHDLELLKASAIATTMIAVAVSGMLICWARRRFPRQDATGGFRWR